MHSEEISAREQIRDRLARYTIASDRADYEAVSLCFVENGTFKIASHDELIGRREIANTLRSWAKSRGHGERSDVFQLHLLGISLIDYQKDEARVTTYFQGFSEIGPDHVGTYNDHFRNTDGQWLIARRVAIIKWVNPASRSASKIAERNSEIIESGR